MEDNTYVSSVAKVVRFLISNKNRWITDYEIINIAPEFGEKIINEIIAYHVVITTKDGICFDDDCIDALKMYLRRFGVKID